MCVSLSALPSSLDSDLTSRRSRSRSALTAYSGFGNNNIGEPLLLTHPTVKKIAEQKGADAGQVLIAWGMHGDHAIIPKSVTESRCVSLSPPLAPRSTSRSLTSSPHPAASSRTSRSSSSRTTTSRPSTPSATSPRAARTSASTSRSPTTRSGPCVLLPLLLLLALEPLRPTLTLLSLSPSPSRTDQRLQRGGREGREVQRQPRQLDVAASRAPT